METDEIKSLRVRASRLRDALMFKFADLPHDGCANDTECTCWKSEALAAIDESKDADLCTRLRDTEDELQAANRKLNCGSGTEDCSIADGICHQHYVLRRCADAKEIELALGDVADEYLVSFAQIPSYVEVLRQQRDDLKAALEKWKCERCKGNGWIAAEAALKSLGENTRGGEGGTTRCGACDGRGINKTAYSAIYPPRAVIERPKS